MIPTLLLVGFVAGRWYVVGLAAVVWPLLLALSGTIAASDIGNLTAAAGFAAANTAVGVAVHKALLALAREAVRAVGAPRRRHSG